MDKFLPADAMPEPSSPSDSLRKTAVDWCIRLQSGECSAAEREAFQRWHDADPRHAEEYARMSRIWRVSGQLAPLPPARRTLPLRPLARAAAVVLLLGGGWAAGWSAGVLPASVRYYAAEDAHRPLELPDHSRVELNRRSSLWYLGYKHRRSVRLSDGEAYFDVQRDTRKPFVIETDNARVRVTGTHFNIWTASQRTTVTVTQGSVLATAQAGGQAAELTAGMQALFAPGQPHQLRRVDPANAAAWRSGRLVLDDISLREALPQLNRYLARPLALADDSAAELRIGGSYDTAKLDQLVDALPQILPVRLDASGDDLLISSRRPTTR